MYFHLCINYDIQCFLPASFQRVGLTEFNQISFLIYVSSAASLVEVLLYSEVTVVTFEPTPYEGAQQKILWSIYETFTASIRSSCILLFRGKHYV